MTELGPGLFMIGSFKSRSLVSGIWKAHLSLCIRGQNWRWRQLCSQTLPRSSRSLPTVEQHRPLTFCRYIDLFIFLIQIIWWWDEQAIVQKQPWLLSSTRWQIEKTPPAATTWRAYFLLKDAAIFQWSWLMSNEPDKKYRNKVFTSSCFWLQQLNFLHFSFPLSHLVRFNLVFIVDRYLSINDNCSRYHLHQILCWKN